MMILKGPQTEKWRAYCKNDKGEIGIVWEGQFISYLQMPKWNCLHK